MRLVLHPAVWLLVFFLAPGVGYSMGISIVGLSSSGGDISGLAVGDVLTIDLALHNETHLEVYGVGVAAWGYDPNRDGVANDGLRFVGGASSESVFNEIRHMDISLGGITNSWREPFEQISQERNADQQWADFGLAVQMMGAITLSPASGDGSLDVGLGGGLVGQGDHHIRVMFEAVSLLDSTELTLNFGVGNPTCQIDVSLCDGHRGAVVLGEGGRPLLFENASLLVSILADPSFDLPVEQPAPSEPDPGSEPMDDDSGQPSSPVPDSISEPPSVIPWTPRSSGPTYSWTGEPYLQTTSIAGNVIPEPGTGLLLGMGLFILSARRDWRTG